jgi:hypothetical protein
MTATVAPGPWPVPSASGAPVAWRFGRLLTVEGRQVLQWVLRRNCSMSPRQVFGAYLLLCFVSLLIAGGFTWWGAAPVLAFARVICRGWIVKWVRSRTAEPLRGGRVRCCSVDNALKAPRSYLFSPTGRTPFAYPQRLGAGHLPAADPLPTHPRSLLARRCSLLPGRNPLAGWVQALQ